MTVNLPPVAILAGGLGTRLQPITQKIPKAMVEVKGIPFVDYQLRLLYAQGLRRVVMCVGYLGEMLQEYTGDGARYGLQIDYIYDGDVLLGTAGALKNALPHLDDAFFIVYGDAYLRCDYHQLHQTYLNSRKPAVMTVYRNEGKWDTSNVIFADGVVQLYDKYQRNPDMAYIDYGIALVNRRIFDEVPTGVPTDLATIYHELSKKKLLVGYEVLEPFYEVGTSAGIERFEIFLDGQNRLNR